jgi:hypothetical protein
MCSVTAQTRVLGQLAAKAPQPLKNFLGSGLAPDQQGRFVFYQLDLVTFLQAEFSNKLRRQTDGERITPSCNLHTDFLTLDLHITLYIQRCALARTVSCLRGSCAFQQA